MGFRASLESLELPAAAAKRLGKFSRIAFLLRSAPWGQIIIYSQFLVGYRTWRRRLRLEFLGKLRRLHDQRSLCLRRTDHFVIGRHDGARRSILLRKSLDHLVSLLAPL